MEYRFVFLDILMNVITKMNISTIELEHSLHVYDHFVQHAIYNSSETVVFCTRCLVRVTLNTECSVV
jgi:hypothetical protein